MTIDSDPIAQIRVIGAGGAGGKVIQYMIEASLEGVHFIYADTDAKALALSQASVKIQLGEKLLEGLGADSNPDIGGKAAEESKAQIRDALAGADMVFIIAGMGGGTGASAAAIIAQEAKEIGALTVGVVCKPFAFEGEQRMQAAEMGIAELRKHVDSLIVIPNECLRTVENTHDKPCDMFKHSDEMLYLSVRSISDLIMIQGYIAVDFADIRTVMAESGLAMMGIGKAKGEGRAREAAMRVIRSPFFETVSLTRAKTILITIFATEESLGIDEYTEINDTILDATRSAEGADANIITGLSYDSSMGDELRVIIIATDIDADRLSKSTAPTIQTPKAAWVQQSASEANVIPRRHPPLNLPTDLFDEEEIELPIFIRKQLK